MELSTQSRILVRQKRELWELAGLETKNSYEILRETGEVMAYALEPSKGFWGFILRQFFGHWRRFNLNIYGPQRTLLYTATHPFRFFFQRLEVRDAQGQLLGVCQQRFGLFTKKFDFTTLETHKTLKMRSGFFRIWTFPLTFQGREVARITKKWGGLLKEIFLDADSFAVDFQDPSLTEKDRTLILLSALFVDLQYFEKKQ